MGIMNRMLKIFKADIHGVMDQFEDQGLLLKQHLRDMEEALNNKETKLKNMLVSRNQMQQELSRYKQQRDKMEQDLVVAIQKKKDDIARMLIKKMKPLDDLHNELTHSIETLDHEIEQFKDYLDQQRLQYEQLKHRSIEYFHKAEMQQWQKNMSTLVPPNNFPGELSEGEIELELTRRKEAILGTGGGEL